MADLQQQLQAILRDPETMGQISALAGALTGSGQDESSPQAADQQPVEPPELSALLASLGESGSMPDPALIQAVMSVWSAYSTSDDKKTALLEALKPFLSPSRREKLDRAEQSARLTRAAGAAYRLWSEGGFHV